MTWWRRLKDGAPGRGAPRDRMVTPACALAALALLALPALAADGSWLETRRAHYSVFYRPGFQADAAMVARWADAAEGLMRSKYGVTPEHYRMSIYLDPAPIPGVDVDHARNRCCTADTDSVGVGTIEMLAPSASAMRAAHAVSSLGLPKTSEDYQAKDAYNGGATFMAFLAAQFGEEIHARLLRDPSPTFRAALAAATRPDTQTQLFARFNAWLDSQSGPGPAAASGRNAGGRPPATTSN